MPDIAPAISLRDWRTGPNTVTPVDGSGGFHPLVPIDEPASVGAPPSVPDLVESVTWPWPTRRKASRSGEVRTGPADNAARLTMPLRWTGLTKLERDALLAWFRDEVQWTVKAFDVEPDGPGTGTLTVRATGNPVDTYEGHGHDHAGVYRVEVVVEEVWA